MSQYMTFVVRKDDVFTPIYTCSRSSSLYQNLKAAVDYGKLSLLPDEELRECIEREEAHAQDLIRDVAALEANKRLVSDWNNPIEEKLEAIEGYDARKQAILDDIEEIQDTIVRLKFLRDIIEELTYFKDYLKKEAGLYAGIEVGYDLTLEDLRK